MAFAVISSTIRAPAQALILFDEVTFGLWPLFCRLPVFQASNLGCWGRSWQRGFRFRFPGFMVVFVVSEPDRDVCEIRSSILLADCIGYAKFAAWGPVGGPQGLCH